MTRQKRGPENPVPEIHLKLLAEIPIQQTLHGLAVAGLVASHLMDGVVDGVEVQLLGTDGQSLASVADKKQLRRELTKSVDFGLYIGKRIAYYLAQEE